MADRTNCIVPIAPDRLRALSLARVCNNWGFGSTPSGSVQIVSAAGVVAGIGAPKLNAIMAPLVQTSVTGQGGIDALCNPFGALGVAVFLAGLR